MNFKEIAFLLRGSQYDKNVRLINYFKKYSKGVGTVAATKDLYFSMLDKSLDKASGNGDANWIEKPNRGIATPNFIKEWILHIGFEGLLEYFSKSTLRDAFGCLYKSELIYMDNFNRVYMKYPVNNKMLSPKFAAVAILSAKKKSKNILNESESEKTEKEDVKKNVDKKENKEYNEYDWDNLKEGV